MAGGKLINVTKSMSKSKKDLDQDARIKRLEKTLYPSIEKKIVDIKASAAGVSSSGYANYPMFQVAQGDDVSERVGDKVCIKEHRFKCCVRRGDNNNLLRIILAITPSTTNLVLADVLEYSNYTTDADVVFASPYKKRPTNAEKTYEILYDKVVNLGDDQQSFMIDKRIKCGKYGKNVSFSDTGASMPENYQVCLLAISDSTASGHPTLNYIFRSKYTDL